MRKEPITEEELHLKTVLEGLGQAQRQEVSIGACPRCGYRPMNPKLMFNPLSRYADIFICESCGMEEAMMAAAHQPPLPFAEWAAFRNKAAQDPSEELLAYVCDHICKHRELGGDQDAMDARCEKCRLGDLAKAAQEKQPPIREQEPARDTFVSAVEDVREAQWVKQCYALGLMLNQECPDNDCIIYRNIFNMARELDGAIEIVSGYPATVLQYRLHERIRELREMWLNNCAILAYRAQHGKEWETPGPWHPGTKEKSGYAAEALTGQGRRQAPPQS